MDAKRLSKLITSFKLTKYSKETTSHYHITPLFFTYTKVKIINFYKRAISQDVSISDVYNEISISTILQFY